MTRFVQHPTWLVVAAVGLVEAVLARPAAAQDIEVPILVIERNENSDETQADDDELDLANLVTSAAKGVTTIQEAPAIVTVIPGDEIRDRQVRTLLELGDLVPGFLRFDQFRDLYPIVMTRGVTQAVLLLRDGFSMFDPMLNDAIMTRVVPLEMVKRVEIISGPGGVLWGANSFLGVMNVISRDAEDIDGVEANLSYADGKGDRSDYRGYAMAGLPHLFGKDGWGLVLHTAFQSYVGPIRTRPGQLFSLPLPNPNSLFIYGPIQDSDPKRSQIIQLDGKLALGDLTLQWMVPWMTQGVGVGFTEPAPLQHLPEDDLPECSPVPLGTPGVGDAPCSDRGRASRYLQVANFDRYGLAEYKTRFSRTAGMSTKAYFMQFVRRFDRLLILPPTRALLPGGLTFDADVTTYRVGANVDGDLELSEKARVLYGFEAFHDWFPGENGRSRQGKGAQLQFYGPYDLAKLPLACPMTGQWDAVNQVPTNATRIAGCPMTFVFSVSRTTVGGFTALQLRPTSSLILDGGVRLQAAPELTADSRGYGLAPTFSGAAVYQFAKDWHVKLNYAEGFRPPVFNNTDSNGEGVEIDGRPDLRLETSRSTQFEVNARLLKGQARIRELDVRADYSYTTMDNYIAFIGGRYVNTSERGIHSAELLAKLYLKGGHRFELGYTYNRIDMADLGAFLSEPNNWFNLGTVHQLADRQVELTTVLRVYGAFEDPNRRVEARGLKAPTNMAIDALDPTQAVTVYPQEQVMDRAPPSADLQVGVRVHLLDDKLLLQSTVYNAFGTERLEYDGFGDLEPRLDISPNRFEGFRFFTSLTGTF